MLKYTCTLIKNIIYLLKQSMYFKLASLCSDLKFRNCIQNNYKISEISNKPFKKNFILKYSSSELAKIDCISVFNN